MKLRFELLVFLAALNLHNPASAETIEVETERDADAGLINVEVRLSLPFKYDEIWDVLIDYEHMPQFVPDIQEAELVESGPEFKRVRLKGEATLLFMHFPIEALMEVELHSATHVSLKSLEGNLGIKGDVYLEPGIDGTRVIYFAHLLPSFWMHPVIGQYVIGMQIRNQFKGMVAEMHRRYDSKGAQL